MGTRNFLNRMVSSNQGVGAPGGDIPEVDDSAAYRLKCGTGTLVTGAVVIATGLNGVNFFAATITSTGVTATGAAEVETLHGVPLTTTASPR